MSNHRDTSFELRDLRLFSGSDAFMRGGHQIINSNRANAGPKRKNADWTKSDKKVQELLLSVFPNMLKDKKQRKRAGDWLRVIHLYHRSGLSRGDVAAEIGITSQKVKDLLQCIQRALAGRTCRNNSVLRKKTSQERYGE